MRVHTLPHHTPVLHTQHVRGTYTDLLLGHDLLKEAHGGQALLRVLALLALIALFARAFCCVARKGLGVSISIGC